MNLAAPELARLTDIRAGQEGNTLDTALTLTQIGRDLESTREVAQVRSAEKALRDLSSSLVAIEPSELTTAEAPPDVNGLVHQALQDLERVRSRSDLKRAVAIGERMRRLESAVLADVLTSIVYALSLGDPGGRTFLAGNVARRHEFGRHLVTPIERERTRWLLPFETAGDGEPWHVRGALLGLDIGLGRLALRRTHGDLPELHPTISQGIAGHCSTRWPSCPPRTSTTPVPARVLEWMKAGRARVKTWTRDARRHADPARRRRTAGAGRRVDRRLGPADSPPPVHADRARAARTHGHRSGACEWGISQTPLDGSLLLAFPIRPRRSATAADRARG